MCGIMKFLRAAGRLKRLPRTGWLEAGVESPESVADHSYRTAVLSMVLADLHGLDAERAVRMALLHDLDEAEIGDLTPEQKRRRGAEHRGEEDAAMRSILSTLPQPLVERYWSLWTEFREVSSPEAEVVARADRAEMLLQALEYEEAGIDPSRLDRFWHADTGGRPLSERIRAMLQKMRVDERLRFNEGR